MSPTKTGPGVVMPGLKMEIATCVIVNAPEWFQRDDFQAWRRGCVAEQAGGPATWHPEQEGPGDYQDVFITFDRGPNPDPRNGDWEGSDDFGLPDDIYAALGEVLRLAAARYGVIWIKPV